MANQGVLTIAVPKDLVRKAGRMAGSGSRSPEGLVRAALSEYVGRREEEQRLLIRWREARQAHREGRTKVLKSLVDLG